MFPAAPSPSRLKIPHLRWVIALLLFLAAILNYVDRQALALLKPTISKDLGLTDTDYGNINSAFLFAYLIAYLASGRIVDRIGPRVAMTIFLGWWSIANTLTAFTRGAFSLGSTRFLLGLGEAGNWPASAKAVAEWFPPKERALGVGFYTFGATLGATIAPLLIIALNTRFGWRATFVATGLAGLLWLIPWYYLYRNPSKHPHITQAELELLQTAEPETPEPPPATPWRTAFTTRAVWLLLFARMLTDPLWYFYQQWFPSYLQTTYKLDQKDLGITWLIFLAADLGTLLGGFGSAFLIKRGSRPAKSRLWVMLACALLMPLSAVITTMPTTTGSLVLAGVVVFAHMAWLANITALVIDVLPRNLLATCFGIVGAGSALGGILMNQLVAHLATTHNYTPWFFITALLHPIAWALLYLGLRSSSKSETP